ncbi:MAG: histidine kinase dimerization/phospho-acceptor domain-containing protein [Lachnospiraceae bacterium]|nr:histidine kinase dimerization/phospho-acceptor domain-containing protein [Lachnospiraceae bacterium]
MRELVEEFLIYYMTERNIEKAAALLTEDVISLGTGEQEIGIGKDAAAALYLKEVKQSPNPIFFHFLEYKEQILSIDARMCYAKVGINTRTTEGEKLAFEGRLTSSSCRQDGIWKLSSFHMSMAAASQEEEEFLPLQSLYGKAEPATTKNAIELMKDMLPGGIIGGYMEPGFPLYTINDEMLALMGFDSYEEMIYFSDGFVNNLIYPEDRERVDQYVGEVLKNSDEYDITYRQLKKDGSFFWVHDKGRRIVLEDGREAIISVLVDVSDIEQAASAAEEHLDAIMRMNPTAMSTFRINLTQDSLSHAVSKYGNLQALEAKGTVSGYVEDALKFIPYEEEREKFARTFAVENLLKAYQDGHMQVAMNHHYIPDENQQFILQTIVSMIRNAATKEIEGVVYTLDITQKIYNEKINDLLINDSDLGIIVVNIKKGTFFSPSFTASSEFKPTLKEQDYAEGVGQIVDHFIVQEEKEHCREGMKLDYIVTQLKKEGKYSINSIWENDGKRRDMRFTCYYFDELQEQFVGIYEDVTDAVQKDHEYGQKLREALEEAKRANRAKTDFLSRMSHDIRTPLNGVIGMTEIALKENQDPRLKFDLETIKSSGKFLLSLINDILDVSRIESGKMELHPEPYAVAQFEQMIEAIICPMMEEKNITFRTDD